MGLPLQRILVCTAFPEIKEAIRRALKGKHHYILHMIPSHEVLASCEDQNLALIVLDLSPDSLGGLALCRRIRQCSAVPILGIAMYIDQDTTIAALDAGADDCMLPPLRPEEVQSRALQQ